jgi:hypothetical protein
MPARFPAVLLGGPSCWEGSQITRIENLGIKDHWSLSVFRTYTHFLRFGPLCNKEPVLSFPKEKMGKRKEGKRKSFLGFLPLFPAFPFSLLLHKKNPENLRPE